MKLWGFVDGELKDLKAEIELLKRYRDEAESDAAVARLLVDKLRLTDEERKAIEWASSAADPDYTGHTATLRGLLARCATGHQE